MALDKNQIAKRIAQEVKDGYYVNLGIGIPTLVANFVPVGIQLLMGQHAYKWNEMMAMSALGCLPILILFLFFQRFFVGGLTAGSVKN